MRKKLPSVNSFPVNMKNSLNPFDVFQNFHTVMEVYLNYMKVKEEEETKRVQIVEEARVEIEKIRQQAHVLNHIFEKTFDERREMLQSFFKVLDYGIQQSNPDIINYALSSICLLVKESPVKMLGNLSDLVDRNSDGIAEI